MPLIVFCKNNCVTKYNCIHSWFYVFIHSGIYTYVLFGCAGAGVYVQSSYFSSETSLPNNSALVWKYPTYSYYKYEMDIYCMSNSTSSSEGSLISPYGYVLRTTFCGVGCFQMYSSSSYLSSSYRGIYTCRIADSRGMFFDLNFGIYPYNERYTCKQWKYLLTVMYSSRYAFSISIIQLHLS